MLQLNRASLEALRATPHAVHLSELSDVVDRIEKTWETPNTRRFSQALSLLPKLKPSVVHLESWVETERLLPLSESEHARLQEGLMALRPWRKGPFRLFGVELDAEWRADMKWNRIQAFLPSLQDKRVLDIGCNSGYYLFRMAAQNPKFLLGIDPMALFYYQFQALQTYIQAQNTYFLPISLEQASCFKPWFDCVLCMGVLYHSRYPVDMLKQIKALINPRGFAVIETLIIEGEGDMALAPYPRYAKMPNVHFLPTLNCLKNWIKKAGFSQCECMDQTYTTLDEQRRTLWVNTESLADFLDPQDPAKTIEGYPAPLRAILKVSL